mmetsp:Transcript_48408/g.104912  ORF Transcript_48408/g.104912 Transcript_48408/m.104912 type:complete len:497 (-) Transcript_48408:271-1761(-)
MEDDEDKRGSRRHGARHGARLLAEVRDVLLHVYERDPYPTAELRWELASTLGITPRKVQFWFQNQRQRGRRSVTGRPGIETVQHVPASSSAGTSSVPAANDDEAPIGAVPDEVDAEVLHRQPSSSTNTGTMDILQVVSGSQPGSSESKSKSDQMQPSSASCATTELAQTDTTTQGETALHRMRTVQPAPSTAFTNTGRHESSPHFMATGVHQGSFQPVCLRTQQEVLPLRPSLGACRPGASFSNPGVLYSQGTRAGCGSGNLGLRNATIPSICGGMQPSNQSLIPHHTWSQNVLPQSPEQPRSGSGFRPYGQATAVSHSPSLQQLDHTSIYQHQHSAPTINCMPLSGLPRPPHPQRTGHCNTAMSGFPVEQYSALGASSTPGAYDSLLGWNSSKQQPQMGDLASSERFAVCGSAAVPHQIHGSAAMPHPTQGSTSYSMGFQHVQSGLSWNQQLNAGAAESQQMQSDHSSTGTRADDGSQRPCNPYHYPSPPNSPPT